MSDLAERLVTPFRESVMSLVATSSKAWHTPDLSLRGTWGTSIAGGGEGSSIATDFLLAGHHARLVCHAQALQALGCVDRHGIDEGDAHPPGDVALAHVLVKEHLDGLGLAGRQVDAAVVETPYVSEAVDLSIGTHDGVDALGLEESLELLKMPD
jgi:hypothetical protein